MPSKPVSNGKSGPVLTRLAGPAATAACKKLSIIVADPTSHSPSQLSSSYSPFPSVELFCMATHQGGFLLFLGPEQDCCLPHGPPQPPPIFSMLAPQTLVPGKRGGQEHVQLCKHVHLHCCLSATIGISVGDSRVGDLHFTSLLQLWRFRCSKGLCPGDQNTSWPSSLKMLFHANYMQF